MPRDVASPDQMARSRFVRLWRLWRRRAAERNEAARFGERELRDIGVTRGDVYREFTRRLWLW